MQVNARQVTASLVGTVAMPSELYNNLSGTLLLDGIPVPANSSYRSAVLIANPGSTNAAMGLVAYNTSQTSQKYELHEAPNDPLSSWPIGKSFTAVCGVSHGLVAFAMQDEGVLTLRLHNSAVAATGTWDINRYIAFKDNIGTVQSMLERNSKIYGFIKGKDPSQNAFFCADINSPNQYPQIFPYTGAAASAFFPIPPSPIAIPYAVQRIAFCNDRIFAIDETNASVLCAVLNNGTVSSHALAKPDSWSLAIDEQLQKAYCRYTTTHGNVLGYTIDSAGDFHRVQDTIHAAAGVSPVLDQNLGLLYMVGVLGSPLVYDVATDTAATVNGDALPIGEGFPGAWVDSAHNILYVSGIGDKSIYAKPSNICAYQISSK